MTRDRRASASQEKEWIRLSVPEVPEYVFWKQSCTYAPQALGHPGFAPSSSTLTLTNGDGTDTRVLVKRYQELQQTFGGGPFGFFHTTLELLRSEGDEQGLQVWSPVKRYQKFRSVLNYEALSPEQKRYRTSAVHARRVGYGDGSRVSGHPALGAAALALLPIVQHDVPLLATFSGALKNDVASGLAGLR